MECLRKRQERVTDGRMANLGRIVHGDLSIDMYRISHAGQPAAVSELSMRGLAARKVVCEHALPH